MENQPEKNFPWTYPTPPQETDTPPAAPIEQESAPVSPIAPEAPPVQPLQADPTPVTPMQAPPEVILTAQPAAPQLVPEASAPVKKKKEKKPLSATAVIALSICFSLIGGILGGIGIGLFMKDNKESTGSSGNNHTTIVVGNRENTVIDINEVDTSKIMTPAEVYAANVNSTVGITTSVTTNFWGYQTTSAASGSGFVLSSDGYILTNQHVIEGSSAITVTFYDGTTADAELIGYDVNNDIAVLKVDGKDLQTVTLGDSDNLNVGDDVVAIGNPLGELTFSLTAGAISALDREVTTSTGVTMNLIQTDCAINSGNSGGALFNLYGEVVGITNAKYSSNTTSGASIDNIGFAIPVNNIRDIVTNIIEKGYIPKPYIGVSVTDVSSETQAFGLPQGAAVKEIVEGSPAEAAGLQINDIITHVNGEPITGSTELVNIVGDCVAGDLLTLTVYRQGASMDIALTVGEKIQSAIEEQTPATQETPSGYNDYYGQFPFDPFSGYGGYGY